MGIRGRVGSFGVGRLKVGGNGETLGNNHILNNNHPCSTLIIRLQVPHILRSCSKELIASAKVKRLYDCMNASGCESIQ